MLYWPYFVSKSLPNSSTAFSFCSAIIRIVSIFFSNTLVCLLLLLTPFLLPFFLFLHFAFSVSSFDHYVSFPSFLFPLLCPHTSPVFLSNSEILCQASSTSSGSQSSWLLSPLLSWQNLPSFLFSISTIWFYLVSFLVSFVLFSFWLQPLCVELRCCHMVVSCNLWSPSPFLLFSWSWCNRFVFHDFRFYR